MGQREHLVTSLQGLLGMAKIPEGQGCIGQAGCPRVLPVREDVRMMSMGVIEGNPLFRLRTGGGHLSQGEQSERQRSMGF
jgi:hypothetical protein